ncbi:unnamed protein product [Mucor hiemalis]
MSDSSKVIHPFFQIQQQKKPNVQSTNTPTHTAPVFQPSVTNRNEKPPKLPNIDKSPPPTPPVTRTRKAKTAATQKTQQILFDELQPTPKEVHQFGTMEAQQPIPKVVKQPTTRKAQQLPPRKTKAQQPLTPSLPPPKKIAIYGHAHEQSLSPSSSSLLSPHDRNDGDSTMHPKLSIHLGALISDRQQAFFQSAAATRLQQQQQQQQQHNVETKTRRYPKSGMHIETQADVEAFLDLNFPLWHTFPACVILSQLVFNKSNHLQINQQTSWNDKYRPKSVNGLLGDRSNSLYLKDWLHQMKIEPMSAPTASSHDSKGRKKKKMKTVQLHDLDGLSLQDDEDDDDFMPVKKSAKQLKRKSMRSNIILLAGDHGVGKTASVYTAADQLGYEVFEINTGTKRSGKDIMSMVGEMTKSHHVVFGIPQKQLTIEQKTSSVKKRRLNPCLSSQSLNDTSGDGLLKHFLRKKEPSPPKTKPQVSNGPKQSLILLEEVDLLFEEDKGFWTSVIELSQKSKRPIIMTCNGK